MAYSNESNGEKMTFSYYDAKKDFVYENIQTIDFEEKNAHMMHTVIIFVFAAFCVRSARFHITLSRSVHKHINPSGPKCNKHTPAPTHTHYHTTVNNNAHARAVPFANTRARPRVRRRGVAGVVQFLAGRGCSCSCMSGYFWGCVGVIGGPRIACASHPEHPFAWAVWGNVATRSAHIGCTRRKSISPTRPHRRVDSEAIRTPAGRAHWISSPPPSPLGHAVFT